MSRNGKETKSNYRVRVYQIPGKPEIVDPASELMAGVPDKVGTCVSKGGYPAGTLSWHLDGKTLIPDGKGVSVKEETKRHPETGLFTLRSELMVTPDRGGAPHPTFSCSFSPGLPRRRALHTAPIQLRVWGEHRTGEGPNLEPVPLEEVLLVVEPEGGAVAPGGTVTLTCEAPAQPPPQIHWIKDGMPLPLPTSSVLLLPEVGPEDQGTYSCVATHPSHGPQESHAVSVSIIETGEEGPTAGEGLDKVREKQTDLSMTEGMGNKKGTVRAVPSVLPVSLQALWKGRSWELYPWPWGSWEAWGQPPCSLGSSCGKGGNAEERRGRSQKTRRRKRRSARS
ncbi:advanced glycosylation end product-specific receptor isoform X5 [Sagmatias obliquidens]|uniref:advanced glycosylation end product-specific receptor isoform X5 n=1 Tax=Sagmatias obliquidens TaxID=3371155 RepID=UPI000F4417A3|nr:advanced glycosylation end product-specific receptor isoform X5 [Lagenorhynchus obliquidens]